MFPLRLPRHIKWILLNAGFLVVFFFIYRMILFKTFTHGNSGFTIKMFWLGLRFDLRFIAIVLLPVFLFAGRWNPFESKKAKRFWVSYLGLMYVLLLLFFVVDFQYYAYRASHLDAEILGYAEDAKISMRMVWQSYPVLKITLLILLILFIIVKIVQWLTQLATPLRVVKYNPHKNVSSLVFFFLMALCIYGKLGQFPLRWSDAFIFNDEFKSNTVLNPFQSFFSSLKYRNEKPDMDKVRFYNPLIAKVLQIPANPVNLQYTRSITPENQNRPNLVVVLCESFSYYKTSMCNNPLDPTPYFNALRKQGVFFTNCFSPAYGTARGVWATVTGIPDVTFTKTATRIPRAVEQHTIINDLNGYEKYYFLGGSASWANIRGLLKNNISGLRLFEEEDYLSPKVDVWGISDHDLFKEANQVLQNQQHPFFAVIQTANNHRPYTIPSGDAKKMGILKKPLDSLLQFGFNVENDANRTNEEYNAMRYMDYSIHCFMEDAKKQSWFSNTIFLFIGDHGIRGNGGNLIPEVFNKKGLTCEQVPLLIYAPGLLAPAQMDFVCSQIDVLPTLAGVAGLPYTNTTLGRDLFKIAKDSMAPKFAFIFDIDTKEYGIIDNDNYYFKKIKGKEEGLIPYHNAVNLNPIQYYRSLAEAFFETSRYLIYNNHKK